MMARYLGLGLKNMLKQGSSSLKCLLCNHLVQKKAIQPRCMCSTSTSSSSLLKISMDKDTGVATVAMNRPPVNSLNLDLLRDLHFALEKLEKSSTGIIITSALPGIYSAGLDITEMYQSTKERLSAFWFNFQELYIKLYGSSRPVIAAINGNAPAGGCLIVLCADYRIMADTNFRIGANETQFGIMAPFWFQDVVISTIGEREASKALQLGTLYSAQEALQVGLVDKLVPTNEVLTAAAAEMNKWTKIPDYARRETKVRMNKNNFQTMISQRDEDVKNSVDFLMKDSIQKNIGVYLESLSTKTKK